MTTTSGNTNPASVQLSAQAFRDVIGRFASGVTVITTCSGGRNFGTTASAVTSLTDDPPMLLICLNKSSTSAHAIRESGTFAVNVLAEDHVQLAGRFASKLPDKFEGMAFEKDGNGSPLLVGAIAHLVCSVSEQVEAGTHYVFLARVEDAVAYPGHPLAYFRGAFGRMQMAPDASVLREVRERIITTVNEVDQAIDLDRWAAELAVGVDLVHRALIALVSEGLVRREAGQFVIAPVPESIIFESYTAKLAIELGVAESTVGRVSQGQLTQLRQYMEATFEFIKDDRFTDPEAWIQANERFHEYMVELAGSKILLDTYRRLGLPGLNARTINRSTYATAELLNDHRKLVEAYENKDLGAVVEVLREHADRPRQLRARERELFGRA
ncbi:flavin reductase [Arthrobacter sulfonylureivorans]|uniref:flavin reductase n=1 Tax=Arthrobacter TaxID=1663 RepID=UPI0010ABA4A8|nr:flavin reductase [Arthrobacter sp. CAU 1506]TJY66135.1 FCD domain-containing protein [Arthrobacter sp. CAU 1506]